MSSSGVLFIPSSISSSYNTTTTAMEESPTKRKIKAKKSRTPTKTPVPASANFLMGGGSRYISRVTEEAAARVNRAAVKDLKVANEALAKELVRTRDMADELRGDRHSLEANYKMSTEQLTAAADAAQRAEVDHRQRVQELQKLLRDEHALRNELEAEVAESRDTAAALRARIEEANTTMWQSADVVAELREKCGGQEAALAAEQRSLKDARQRVEALEAKLAAESEQRQELQGSSNTMGASLVQMTDRNTELIKTVEVLRCSLEARDVKLRELEGDAAGKSAAMADAANLLSQLQAAKTEAASAGEESMRAKSELHHTCQELEGLRVAMEVMRDENQRLEGVVRHEQDSCRAAATSEAAALSELTEVKTLSASRYEEDLRSLQSRLEDSQSRYQALDASSAAQSRAAGERLQELQSSLQDMTQLAETRRQELGQLLGKSESLSREADSATSRLREAEQRAEDLQVRLDSSSVALEGREAAYKDVKRSFEGQVELLKRELAGAEAEAGSLRSKVSALASQLSMRDQELQDVGAISTREMSKRGAHIDELTAALAAATDKYQALQESSSEEIRLLERQTKSLQAEVRNVSDEAARAREEASAATRSRDASCDQTDKLTGELRRLKGDLERVKSELAAERGASSKLRSEAAAAQSAHTQDMEKKSAVLAEVMAAMQVEERNKAQAEAEVRRLAQRTAALVQETDGLRSTVEEARAAKENAMSAYSSLERTLTTTRRKADSLSAENKTLMTSYDSYMGKLLDDSARQVDVVRTSLRKSPKSAHSPGATSSATPSLTPRKLLMISDDEADLEDYSSRLTRLMSSARSKR